MKRAFILIGLLAALAMLAAACQPAAPSGGTANDLLGEITSRGTLRVSTDPNYAPQSVLKQGGARTANTKCAADELTAGELEGFDIDVAVELGKRLGVETCFATPDWDVITAGNWGNRWDVSVGSMTITTPRQEVLHFSEPYYYAPAQFAASTASGITSLEGLNGQAICVGASTTYDQWLSGQKAELGFPDSSFYAEPPTGVTVVPLTTDQECAQAIEAGRTDFPAYLTSLTVVEQNIKDGVPVVKVGDPVYSEQLAVAIDKSHAKDTASLLTKINEAVTGMHSDGTLSRFSSTWFGSDLTQDPAK